MLVQLTVYIGVDERSLINSRIFGADIPWSLSIAAEIMPSHAGLLDISAYFCRLVCSLGAEDG